MLTDITPLSRCSSSLKPSHPHQSSPSSVRKSPLTIWVATASPVLTIQPIRLPAQLAPRASAHLLLVGVTMRKCPQLPAPDHYQDKLTLHHRLRPPQRQRAARLFACVPGGDSPCSVPPGLAQCPQVSVARPRGPGWQPGAGLCSHPAGGRLFEGLTEMGSPDMYVSMSESPH